MFSEDAKSLLSEFDPMVMDGNKKMIVDLLKSYKENPTKKKMYFLIINLPVGFFLKLKDFENIFNDVDILKYKDLLGFLKDKTTISNLINRVTNYDT